MPDPFSPAGEPIEAIERMLRTIVHDVLSGEFGEDWIYQTGVGLGNEWVDKLEAKQKEDERSRKSSIVSNYLLAYSEFRDLGTLIRNHRSLFRQVFVAWDTFSSFFHVAERLRNVVKHHRDLTPSEQSLLIGIAGEFENWIWLWRVGSPFTIKRTIIQFTDLIRVDGRTEAEIIAGVVDRITSWTEQMKKSISATGLRLDRFSIESSSTSTELRCPQLSLKAEASPDALPNCEIDRVRYKGVHAELRHQTSCHVSLDEILAQLGQPYRHISYELVKSIDISALHAWASERAGLSHASTGSTNGILTSVEYTLLNGRFRISAWTHPAISGLSGGGLSATVDSSSLWHAHRLITPRHLMGFIMGDITPRSMTHLVKMAQIPGTRSKHQVHSDDN